MEALPKFDDLQADAPEQGSFDSLVDDSHKYGDIPGQIGTAALGAANSMTAGLASKGLDKAGILSAEEQRGMREANPISYGVGNIAGIAGGPVGEGLSLVGNVAKSALGNGILGSAAKLATEAALFQTTDEVTKMGMQDPNQTLQTAAINIGLTGLLGGAFGATGGILGKGVQKVAGSEVGEFIGDFRSRLVASLERPTSNPLTEKAFSPGAKAADAFLESKFAGKGLGATIGEVVGHSTGIPFAGMAGAAIGAKALGPTLDSIIKPVMRGILNAEGVEAAGKYFGEVINGEKALGNAAKAVFDSSLDVVPSKLITTSEDRTHIKDALKMSQDAPQSILHVGGPLDPYLPAHNVALGQLTANAMGYLGSIQPKPSGMNNPLDTKIPPSKSQEAMFDRALDIANQPLMIMQHIKDGTLMSHDLVTFHAIYPNLYPKMVQSLTNNLIEHQAKGNTVPYRTRVGLSMFMAQPMDGTMTPQAIQATQALYLPKQQPQGGQQAQRAQKNTKPLSKMSSQYQTAEQSREARRNK